MMLGHSLTLNSLRYFINLKRTFNKVLFLCSNLYMKKEIRKYAKEYRKSLDTEKLSLKIYKNLVNLKEYKNSKNICTYYSIGYEVKTTLYLEDNSKNWYLPRINDTDLEICRFNPNCLKENCYKIPEPKTPKETDLSKIDMIIIPCLAADKNGYRIGYGKGFYDRLLKNLKHNPIKVVLSYSNLLFDNIFPDTFDEKCDIIITDEDIYRINC